MEPKEYIERQTLDRLSAENPSTKDLGDGIRMLYSRLWSKEELTNLIAQTHHRLCAKCTKNDDRGWYQKVIWALITAGCTALAYFCKN